MKKKTERKDPVRIIQDNLAEMGAAMKTIVAVKDLSNSHSMLIKHITAALDWLEEGHLENVKLNLDQALGQAYKPQPVPQGAMKFTPNEEKNNSFLSELKDFSFDTIKIVVIIINIILILY